jgi:hypothetical protein
MMFEGSQDMGPGRDEPEIDLEALLAADEAAISDEGFSARVIADVAASARPVRRRLRRLVVGGAGALGFAVAGFSVSAALKLAPATPVPTLHPVAGAAGPANWLDGLDASAVQAAVTDIASSPMLMIGVLVALAAAISLAAAAMQET